MSVTSLINKNGYLTFDIFILTKQLHVFKILILIHITNQLIFLYHTY